MNSNYFDIDFKKELETLDIKTPLQLGCLWWRIFGTDIPHQPETMIPRLRHQLELSGLYKEKRRLEDEGKEPQPLVLTEDEKKGFG